MRVCVVYVRMYVYAGVCECVCEPIVLLAVPITENRKLNPQLNNYQSYMTTKGQLQYLYTLHDLVATVSGISKFVFRSF